MKLPQLNGTELRARQTQPEMILSGNFTACTEESKCGSEAQKNDMACISYNGHGTELKAVSAP